MDTYTYKCEGCGAALEYDPKSGLMICNNCGQMLRADEILPPESLYSGNYEPASAPQYSETAPDSSMQQYQAQPASSVQYSDAASASTQQQYMTVNIYHCSSCGSEIMTNDVEASKMCSYCGQSTIMFDRVSNERKPDKIIPFIITKERALAKAKERFKNAKFLESGIETITVDSVNAIYMPYFAYDCSMRVDVTVNMKNNDTCCTYHPSAAMEHIVTLDASRRFNDYASKQLNPFPVDMLMDFNAAYLSGFYADCNDVSSEDRTENARQYMREIVLERAIEKTPAPQKKFREMYGDLYEKAGAFRARIDNEQFELRDRAYIFCPVYFVTFRIASRVVILLVNGCSGKVVGSIPVDDNKVKRRQNRDSVICALVYGIVGFILFATMPILWSATLFIILAGLSILDGSYSKKKYDKLLKQINSESMFDLIRR